MPDHDAKLLVALRPAERMYAQCCCGWKSDALPVAGMQGEKVAGVLRQAIRVHQQAMAAPAVQGSLL
jgi:hypothetical protein